MSIATKDVYTGMWIDWSKGSQILGSTITLTSPDSRLLAAFLALYVSLSVSYLWLLIVYSIHRARFSITEGRCHAIIRQQQALLKLGLSPASTSIRLIKLYWAYRFTPYAWHYSWLWITVSALSAVSSAAAGLFSSQIIDSSLYINVLTNSVNCGNIFLPHRTDQLHDPEGAATNRNLAIRIDLASIYARDCYNSTSEKSQCNFFPSSTIQWETEWDAECPFDNMCTGPAMRLDTGLLNSNSVLGINSPVADQIDLRKITTCAPIRQNGYNKVERDSTLPEGLNQIVSYLYGPIAGSNETATIHSLRAQLKTTYDLEARFYFNGPLYQHSIWQPIPKLNNTQGDGTLVLLRSNNVQYTEPCDDPMFSAHIVQDTTDIGTYYAADDLAGVVGCLEQYQICSAGSKACSAVDNLGNAFLEVEDKVPLTPMQLSTLNLTRDVLFHSSMLFVTMGNARHLVASRSSVFDILQLTLPSNQWQIEVQFWHSTIMSLIQHYLLEYMTGPNDEDLRKFVETPPTPEAQALCKRQRVRIGQGFANVSSLGLFFTTGVGVIVILLALFLDDIMGCITRLSKGNGKKHRAWIRDDVLYFQSFAYRQEQVFGPRWIATSDDTVPLVEGNGFLDPIIGPREVKIDKSHIRLSVDSLMVVDGTP